MSFENLVVPYAPRIHAWAMRRRVGFHAAQDITQETLFKAYRFLPKFRGGNMWAWLRTIARSCTVRWLRANPSFSPLSGKEVGTGFAPAPRPKRYRRLERPHLQPGAPRKGAPAKTPLQAAIRASGRTMTKIAMAAGCSLFWLSGVAVGHETAGPQLRQKLAEVLNKDLEELFPCVAEGNERRAS